MEYAGVPESWQRIDTHPAERHPFQTLRSPFSEENNRIQAKRRSRRLRKAAIARLGGKCAKCPKDDPILLDVDKINGNHEYRYDGFSGVSQYELYRIARGQTEGFQLLCVECHRYKTRENGDFLPKKRRIELAIPEPQLALFASPP